MRVHLKDTNLIIKYNHIVNSKNINIRYYYYILMIKTILNDGWIDDVYDEGNNALHVQNEIWVYSYTLIDKIKIYFYRNADTY